MGQCGQGNSTGPITKPKKIVGLDGVTVQQISAGTSHSLAWTALPRDRSAIDLWIDFDVISAHGTISWVCILIELCSF